MACGTPAAGIGECGRDHRVHHGASISVVFSACGMKLPGGTMPRCGCFQRSSASVPATSPLASAIPGLMPDLQFAARDRVGQGAQQDQVVAAGAVVGAVVERDRRLARSRPVHRDARLLQQLFGCLRMTRKLQQRRCWLRRGSAGRRPGTTRCWPPRCARASTTRPADPRSRTPTGRAAPARAANPAVPGFARAAAPAPARACRTRCRTCSGSPESCSAA